MQLYRRKTTVFACLHMFLFIFREYPCGFPAALLWLMTVTEERKYLLPFSLSIQSRDWIPSRRPGEMAILQQHDNNITIDNTKQNFNCECYTLYSCIDTTSWRLFFFFPQLIKSCCLCSDTEKLTYAVLDNSEDRKR